MICVQNFDDSMAKDFIIFEADMSSSVNIDDMGKDILILGEGLTQRLHDTTLTAEAKYSINFSRSQRKFCLNLHYNASNSFLFVNATKIYEFKYMNSNSEIKKYPLYLGNISKDFTSINVICLRLNRFVYEFSVDYNIIDTSDIIDIHKYLMKKT